MNERKPQDTVAFAMVTIVAIFVVGSMAALVIAAFAGGTGGERVWAGLFSLMTAILGAIGGYMAGTTIEKGKRNGNDGGPEQVYRPPSQEG